jgi:hypothetical protein
MDDTPTAQASPRKESGADPRVFVFASKAVLEGVVMSKEA